MGDIAAGDRAEEGGLGEGDVGDEFSQLLLGVGFQELLDLVRIEKGSE